MNERGKDGVENMVEILARVLSQKPQHKVSMLLEHGILPPVPPTRLGASEVLRAVQFNDNGGFATQEVHLHFSSAVKGNRQLHIQAKTPGRFR